MCDVCALIEKKYTSFRIQHTIINDYNTGAWRECDRTHPVGFVFHRLHIYSIVLHYVARIVAVNCPD